LALGFIVFFFAAKHDRVLARVSPFGEDPYDAVGSFAVQLAAFAAGLSALRAVLPATERDRGGRASAVLRCAAIALLAIFVASCADAVAMIRHPSVWSRVVTGRWLAAVVALFALASIAGVGRIAGAVSSTRRSGAWPRAAAVVGAGALLLAIYPEAWRRGFAGAILTALIGTALLFAEVSGLALVLLPTGIDDHEDLLDDLAAALGRTRAAAHRTSGGFPRWLRTHHWRIVVATALGLGLGLAAAEAFGEGLPASARRALVVLGVFTGIEAVGILIGYALLRRPLALVRAERP
jgi:hypothetical protein